MARRVIVWCLVLASLPRTASHAEVPTRLGAAFYPGEGYTVSSRRPVFTWPSTPPAPADTVRYDLTVALDSGFGASAQVSDLLDTSAALTFLLEPDQRYWWKVASRDGGGTSESPTMSFRVYLPGDLDVSGAVTSSDIIALVNYVFKGGHLQGSPCVGNGNYDTVVSSSDIIGLVNYVFKSGPPPAARCPDQVPPDSSWLPHEGEIGVLLYEPCRSTPETTLATLPYELSTYTIYPCSNWELLVELDTVAQSFSHQIGGVFVPDVCLTAPWHATWRAQLRLDTGRYEFTYRHAFWEDRRQLLVTDSSLEWSTLDSQFAYLLIDLYWRRPNRSMSVACGVPTDVAWLCDDFLDSLHAHLTLTEFHFPDSGYIPYPTGVGSTGYSPPARYFRFPNASDYDTAVAVLDAFEQTVIAPLSDKPSIHIWLHSWNGRFDRVP